MTKYILKESELKSVINSIVAEEISNVINESLGSALGHALTNTLKTGAMAMIDPAGTLARGYAGAMDTLSGKKSLTKGVKDFFGGDNSSTGKRTGRKSRAERQNDRFNAGRSISWEFGRPETVPGIGRRQKLAPKSQITAPNTNNNITWGDFGEHYHDEGDRAWNRKVTDLENSLIRNARGDQQKIERWTRKYKRRLVDWLKERDKAYRIYIKENNRL